MSAIQKLKYEVDGQEANKAQDEELQKKTSLIILIYKVKYWSPKLILADMDEMHLPKLGHQI